MNDNLIKYGLIAGGVLGSLIAVLYVKNKAKSSSFRPVDKEKVLSVFKQIRKECFTLYKRIKPVYQQVSHQFRGITSDQFKEIIDGPDSPLQFSKTIEQITENACKSQGLSRKNESIAEEEFEENVAFYAQDKEVKRIKQSLEKEYTMALSGRVNEQVSCQIPQISKEKLLQINQKLTKEKYVIQIDMLRKMAGKSEAELMTENFLVDMKVYEKEEQRILVEEGFDDTDQPASALWAATVKKMTSTNLQIKHEIQASQNKYRAVFQRYLPAMQRGDPSVLDDLEQQIIFMQ